MIRTRETNQVLQPAPSQVRQQLPSQMLELGTEAERKALEPIVGITDIMRGSKPGRPSQGKERVHLWLKSETIAKFKATGKGWQSRISDILDGVKL